jgi:hypothetical protein
VADDMNIDSVNGLLRFMAKNMAYACALFIRAKIDPLMSDHVKYLLGDAVGDSFEVRLNNVCL